MTSRHGYTPEAILQRATSSEAFREAARVPEFYLVSATRCDPHGRTRDANGVSATLRAPAGLDRLARTLGGGIGDNLPIRFAQP